MPVNRRRNCCQCMNLPSLNGEAFQKCCFRIPRYPNCNVKSLKVSSFFADIRTLVTKGIRFCNFAYSIRINHLLLFVTQKPNANYHLTKKKQTKASMLREHSAIQQTISEVRMRFRRVHLHLCRCTTRYTSARRRKKHTHFCHNSNDQQTNRSVSGSIAIFVGSAAAINSTYAVSIYPEMMKQRCG